eukprot:TRINITY_DN10693_c0_g2_i1.p1 TRINITY_DN10693_c0_g2~~TRINITY_DN10693_c0_g2_i1.p1  ORF type:complete len:732 (+),score=285.83 TRINITY_DN10693_c0_g2_i1:41-2236(+)
MRTLEAGAKKKKKPAAKKSAKKPAAKKESKPKDERFSSRFTDPRFGYGKKEEKEETGKKVITEKDDRFSLSKFRGRAVDSRGVPLQKEKVQKRDLTSMKEPKSISGYYKQLRKNQGQEVESDEEDFEEASLSQADDSASSGSTDDIEEASLGSDIYEENNNELTEDASKRLALRNCDWDNMDANHIYALMQSFTPMGGALINVKIFTSELGKEQLEREMTRGPNLWVKPGEEEEGEEEEEEGEEEGAELKPMSDDEGNDEDEEDEELEGFEQEDSKVRTEIGTDGERFSENRYRRYEIQRLKYFYAIVEFDGPETAAHVYRECDGTEIERSGTVFDLSFVPDEMDFEDEPKDSCSQLVRGFKANTHFVTNALQNSRFAISWDQTDLKRKQAINALFTEDNDDDLDAYLAPCVSSDEEEGAVPSKEKVRAIRSKYACLFESLGGLSADKPVEGADEGEEEGEEGEDESGSEEEGVQAVWSDSDDMDPEEAAKIQADLEAMESGAEGEEGEGEVSGNMSSTIHIGAKEGSKNLKDVLKVKKDREGETIWEKRLRKKKENRKMAKKERASGRMEQEDDEASEEVAENKKKIKEALGDDAVEVEEKQRVRKKDKRKAHKAKKVAEAAAERESKKNERNKMLEVPSKKEAAKKPEKQNVESKFASRFGKLADPRFMVDPSHPKSKDTKAMQELVTAARETKKRKRQEVAQPSEDQTNEASDLLSKVSYFKKKAKQE